MLRPCRWLLYCAWRRHLRRLAAKLQALQPRLLLCCALHCWQMAVAAAQADDSSMCYRALQLPRAFAAWRLQAVRQAELRLRGEQCRRVLERQRQERVLLAWCRWAAGKCAAQYRLEQAAAWSMRRAKQTALADWRRATQAEAAGRKQQVAAMEHWAARLQRRAFDRWRRWADVRRMGGQWRQLYLLSSAFGSWRQHTQLKAAKAARWRLAVRQRYLRSLWAGFTAWQRHHQHRQQKEQRLEAMRHHHHTVLLQASMAAWAGAFLAEARRRQAQRKLADSCYFRRLLRQGLDAWHGPFLAGARQRRCMQSAANSCRTATLLRQAWLGWLAWLDCQAEKRQWLATAQALLRPGQLRRLLCGWRRFCVAAALRRRQVRRVTEGCGEVQLPTWAVLLGPALLSRAGPSLSLSGTGGRRRCCCTAPQASHRMGHSAAACAAATQVPQTLVRSSAV